ncbi:hypothetical protein [Rhizobium mesoamericanum]|uniref:hypothetical protein n=1 Tax=Rhizobium mesoamericanum TaxID=1079800 RepID=UPI0004276CAD|nr:hypothetical protein [Rhizobium mesoamericanum]
MIYIAIAIAQTIDPLRIAIVALSLGVIWKTVAVRHRLPAVAISAAILALLLSTYIETTRLVQASPIPREFTSEAVIFVLVTLAGFVANLVIAAIALGCGKLFHVASSKAWQW